MATATQQTQEQDVTFPARVISINDVQYTKSNGKKFIMVECEIDSPKGKITASAMRTIEDENGNAKALPTVGQTGVVYVRRREDNNQISLTLSLSNQATLEDAFAGVL